MAASSWKTLEVCKHHEQKDVCFSRAKYREGRRPTAVRIKTCIKQQKYVEPDTSKEVVNNLQKETTEIETGNASEDWNTCTYYGYPMLPPPPQEDLQRCTSVSGKNYLNCGEPTVHDPLFKDFNSSSMGHAANTGKHCVTERSPPSDRRKYHGSKEASFTMTNTSVARFIPRTTHLQDRKRRKEQVAVDSLIGIDKNDAEIFVGPKLPEEPKVDDSLNMSVDFIRNRL
ncbi:RNA-binding protein 48 [Acipenser ruthenus]|uniref:RNA-binding protein 48 n=1 Tax=Acipenser ruthenus TaxID=7906 RepID=A0A444UL90_ACIRT|nr:RNA-binding protein 48 [Acipenser ruthenus]